MSYRTQLLVFFTALSIPLCLALVFIGCDLLERAGDLGLRALENRLELTEHADGCECEDCEDD